jgi:hypothetical protein
MSVRAYRITTIEYAHPDSFNLWHDAELVEFLEKNDYLSALNLDSCGICEIPTELLQEAVDTVNLSPETKANLLKDIQLCSEQGYVTYYCF